MNDKIKNALTYLEPSDYTSDRIYAKIMSKRNNVWRRNRSRLRVAAASLALMLVAGTTAYAASPSLRYVITRFISSFTDEEKEELIGGHGTKYLDKEEVILEFLHQFKDDRISIKQDENGFKYTEILESAGTENVIVACKDEKEYLLVRLEGTEIEDSVHAWKVKSYQIISESGAKSIISRAKKAGKIQKTEDSIMDNPMDTVIKAGDKTGKIYDANDKNHIVALTVNETDELTEIFNEYNEDSEEGWEDEGAEYHYVIKLPDHDIIFTKGGCVIDETKEGTIAFVLKPKDLEKVRKVLKKLDIVLDK